MAGHPGPGIGSGRRRLLALGSRHQTWPTGSSGHPGLCRTGAVDAVAAVGRTRRAALEPGPGLRADCRRRPAVAAGAARPGWLIQAISPAVSVAPGATPIPD